MSVNEKLTAIADNMRSKTGGTEALTLDEMAAAVDDIYQAGVDDCEDELEPLVDEILALQQKYINGELP